MLYVMLMFALVFAQARTGGSTSGGDAGAGGMLGGLFCCMCPFIILALAYVPMIIGAWKVFDKAGEPGWASIVPIYNAMVIARIGGRPETDGLFTLIPIVGIYFAIVILIDMAKAFGKDVGYAIGLLLLPIIFWPMLGFGSAEYSKPGLRRRRDEDDDDDDRPAPRARRPRDEDDEGIRQPRRRDVDEGARRPRRRDDDEGARRPRRRDDDDDDEGIRRPRRRRDDD